MRVVSPIGRKQANEFVDKLESAGFEPWLAQRVVESKDNAFAKELARFAKNREIMASVMEAMLNAPPELLEYWTARKQELASIVYDFMDTGARKTVSAILVGWQTFYWKKFGLKKDFSNIYVPNKPRGFCRLLVLPAGMTSLVISEKCKEYFKLHRNFLHESSCPVNDRGDINDYAVWVRESVGPDGEFEDVSASDCRARHISGITLAERLIYELKYFSETGAHLDTSSTTICVGSHYNDDTVPLVGFNKKTESVDEDYCHSADHYVKCHVRVAKR